MHCCRDTLALWRIDLFMVLCEIMKRFTPEDSDTLEQIINHRRDVRGNRFLDKDIPEPALDKILRAAVNAPSVGFSQPWEFVLVRDPKRKALISQSFAKTRQTESQLIEASKQGLYSELKLEGIHEAPLNIAVFYRPDETSVLGQSTMPETGPYSVVCAVQNMWLMARALNIGLGWVSIVDPIKVKQALNAPVDKQLVAYLCLGYVDYFYETPELERKKWEKRKPLVDLIFNEAY